MITPEAWKEAAEHIAFAVEDGQTPNQVIDSIGAECNSLYADWPTAFGIVAASIQAMKERKGHDRARKARSGIYSPEID